MEFSNILIVCTGNICRSPVAGELLKARLPHHTIKTAGIGALIGESVDPVAKALAQEEGLDVTAHRARQITREMIQQADLILVMSEVQRRAIAQLMPAATGKTLLFGRWLGEGGKGEEVPDPYRKSHEAFEHTHEKLVRAANAWSEKLE